MKQKLLLILTILSLNVVIAQEFEEVGIKYNITSGSTVEVVKNSPVYSGVINIPDTVTHLGITYNVTSIATQAFYQCTGLTSVTIPNSVIVIGAEAFHNCTSLTNVSIPNSVTTIEDNAFNNCTGLASVSIGSSILTIGNYTFNNCTSLTSVSVAVSNPSSISLGVFVFNNVPVSSATLTVPLGSETVYATAAQWSAFGTIAGGTLSINNYILEAAFSMYPNPIQNTLFIKQNEAYQLENIGIYTMHGKHIFNTSEKTIDFSALPTGLYLVKLTTDIGSITKQFIKE
ncbi:leucine-rich repeat domain-containing protein [Lutibacter sp. A80]|uniref:leucine-rich repeat domain-containing protein n=1 Tax=Lutibacter sp. A80 TaxID=2918453 RepID=UPI001F06F045|nr:leucine-rich repeat domain-containing protein [Lutibacter sp. A80]UMB59745.1 leucine-rich repeat domain-containing protein [Lutibacter sp. A80]